MVVFLMPISIMNYYAIIINTQTFIKLVFTITTYNFLVKMIHWTTLSTIALFSNFFVYKNYGNFLNFNSRVLQITMTYTTSDAYLAGCFGHWEVSKMSTPRNFVSPSQGRRRLDTSCREKTPSSDRSPSFPLRYATDRPELPVKVPFLPDKKIGF